MSPKAMILLIIGIIMVSIGIYLGVNLFSNDKATQETVSTGIEWVDVESNAATISNAKTIMKIVGAVAVLFGIIEIAISVGVRIGK